MNDNMVRRASFHRVRVKEGAEIHLQPGEQVMAVEYDGAVNSHVATIMCVLPVLADGGGVEPAPSDGSGGTDG